MSYSYLIIVGLRLLAVAVVVLLSHSLAEQLVQVWHYFRILRILRELDLVLHMTPHSVLCARSILTGTLVKCSKTSSPLTFVRVCRIVFMVLKGVSATPSWRFQYEEGNAFRKAWTSQRIVSCGGSTGCTRWMIEKTFIKTHQVNVVYPTWQQLDDLPQAFHHEVGVLGCQGAVSYGLA